MKEDILVRVEWRRLIDESVWAVKWKFLLLCGLVSAAGSHVPSNDCNTAVWATVLMASIVFNIVFGTTV